jgi:hypothetical protein
MLEEAAGAEYYELVRWCTEHGGYDWADASMAPLFTAQSGSIKLMAWLLEQPDTVLCAEHLRVAAFKGHRALCEFMRAQQCPWDASVTRQAAAGGSVDMLRWLVDSGCPWDGDALRAGAAEGGSMEVLTYLQQLGLLTRTADRTDTLEFAGTRDQLAAAKWLREQGAEWPTGGVCNMWFGSVREWAIAEGFTPPPMMSMF